MNRVNRKKCSDRLKTLHRFGRSLRLLCRIQSHSIGSTPEDSGVFLIKKAKGVVLLSPLCLPIPPPRHFACFVVFQAFFGRRD